MTERSEVKVTLALITNRRSELRNEKWSCCEKKDEFAINLLVHA
jgi:hypothetical protein